MQLAPPLNQRVTQLLGAIENTSAAPTDWEMAQIENLSRRIPPAAEDVRKLIVEDLAALQNLMFEAKIPYIVAPPAPAANRPPSTDEWYEMGQIDQ